MIMASQEGEWTDAKAVTMGAVCGGSRNGHKQERDQLKLM